MVVSLNHCSQNGGNLYRAPYYNGNPNIGPRIKGNLDQSLYVTLQKDLRPPDAPELQEPPQTKPAALACCWVPLLPHDLGFKVSGLGFKVRFRVEGFGLRDIWVGGEGHLESKDLGCRRLGVSGGQHKSQCTSVLKCAYYGAFQGVLIFGNSHLLRKNIEWIARKMKKVPKGSK